MATVADEITPYEGTAPEGITGVILRAFPVPPIAVAFMNTPFEMPGVSKIRTVIGGAVFPEATYLEPTLGQIWPR